MSNVHGTWKGDVALTPRRQAEDALQRAAADLLQRANESVPMETGALRASGQVRTFRGGAEVVYTAPYAMVVHQRLDVHHAHGRAKWLELATIDAKPGILRAVAEAVGKALR